MVEAGKGLLFFNTVRRHFSDIEIIDTINGTIRGNLSKINAQAGI